MKALIVFTSIFSFTKIHAQLSYDTVSFSLNDAEKRFVDSNLLILASHFNVDANKALIKQAKLWNNPVLNTDQVIAADGRFFPYGKDVNGVTGGQYYIQLQQLIETAGKRGKQINIATTNEQISELQLEDLLRNLRLQLRTDYYTIAQQLNNKTLYQNQLVQLNNLFNGMQAQFNAGNIAQIELLRVQAILVMLQQDITDLDKSIENSETDIRTLLRLNTNVFVKPSDTTANLFAPSLSMDSLIQTAKENNPYYLLQQKQYVLQQQNLSYQKALRVPDVTLGPNFDRNSNFAPNYFGLGVSLPIPLFNKNQSNIASANFNVKQQQATVSNAEKELENNVFNAYQNLLLSIKQNSEEQKDFYEKYNAMFQNMLKSYQQKQISLLTFVDFVTDYTNLQQRFYQQQLNLNLSKENLNYQVGIDVIQ
ncbi:MAG TPA: TolC family protein [Parafilimonas sp.]|nr:TolC family protein [Parafilimonas sp.]